MTRKLSLYVGRLFFERALAGILVLTALMQVLDLLDAATDVLERGSGIRGILTYALLRLPIILEQALPLGTLVGALLAFAELARHNEIVALRSTGVSVSRITLAVLPWVAVIMAVQLVLADQVSPRAERHFALWWGASADEDGKAKATWLRVDDALVSIDRVADGGQRLAGVRIYRRAADHQLEARIYAPSAVLEGGRWLLKDAVETVISGSTAPVTSAPADRSWNADLDPSDLIEIMTPFARLSAMAARNALEGSRAVARPPAFYETRLQRIFSEPFACLVMLLLATPAATAHRRGADAGKRLLAGVGAGLLFLLCDGILSAMGEAGRIPAEAAAWGAVGLFGCIGVSILAHLDG